MESSIESSKQTAAVTPQPVPAQEKARAKVNLTLHVKGRRSDGYHELESLVVFADVCDEVFFNPGIEDRLNVDGPFASAIEGENLIFKAKRLLSDWLRTEIFGEFRLTKNIPVAAGLGGGSSDAAAAIRALLRAYHCHVGDIAVLSPIAAKVGADVPVCLSQCAAWMRGLGEEVTPLETSVKLPALLVNPRILLATRDVFQTLNAPPYGQEHTDFKVDPIALDWSSPERVAKSLLAGRNDLEKPAIAIRPAVADVLNALRALKGCLLARLSGSGPTCFGIFLTFEEAKRAERQLLDEHPNWWAAATTLS